ncbi:MAG: hypothetical protein JNK79_17660 [Chitinophagaceae bacterium]|nr:hypothetical protein [Chitinophagaceae bacterium]
MDYRKEINNNPNSLLKKLLTGVSAKKAVDVRYEFDRNDQWAVISVYVDDQDNELALRLHAGGNYELYVGYYDDEDELQEVSRTLAEDEKKEIPGNMKKVMSKVVVDEEGLRVPADILVK